MEGVNCAGRIVGALIPIQLILGVLVDFVLEAPLFGTPGFLVSAAPSARQLGLGSLLGLGTQALWLAMAITLFPLLWHRARGVSLWLFALSTVVLAVAAVECIGVMSMVSLSQAHATAIAGQGEILEAVRVVVASGRNWAHYAERLLDGVTIIVLYVALWRLALAPRALAGVGVVAAVLMLTSVARPFFGGAVLFPLLAPLAVMQLFLGGWLLATSLRRRRDEGVVPGTV